MSLNSGQLGPLDVSMKSLKTACFAVLIAILVASCKDAPGADGRYAHGWGYLYSAGGSRWAP